MNGNSTSLMGSASQRIVCAVTHMDEVTVDLCRRAIESQSVAPSEFFIVSNVSPASAAFNACLDRAGKVGANVLVHVAADCILRQDAFDKLLKRMRSDSVYAVTARGFDVMNGNDAPIGAWALNMDIIGDRFRFRDAFKMDLDFCERIEVATDAVRTKTKRGPQVGYHHPIWLPQEIYHKFRYNAPKYRNKEIQKYIRFFETCLQANPGNKVLRLGLMGLKKGAAESHDFGAPIHDAFIDEWNEILDIVELDGSEFFAYHADFIEIARELLNSDQPLVPMAGNFFQSLRKMRDADGRRGNAEHPGSVGNSRNSISAGASPLLAGETNLSAAPKIGQIYRRGIEDAAGLARALYRRLPTPAKNLYRRARGRPPVTPKVRTANVAGTKKIAHPKEVDREPCMKFGAVNEGRLDWAERWANADRSRRVLLVAPKDFAGSMYKWAEAINRQTDFAARLIAFEYHQYTYPVDLVVPECDDLRLAGVLELADQAGYLHLKDEHSWFLGYEHFTNLRLLNALFFSGEFASVPKTFTHYGGYARKFKADAAYIDAVGKFDARIAMTPDLNYAWFDGAYIPHTIDVEELPYSWSDTKIFAHSPSSPEKKATYLFEEAVQLLPRQNPAVWEGWSVDLISGVSFEECMRRKRRASLFFDQAGRHRNADLGIDDIVGWYGNSAIEAMAFGIPTMAHLAETAFRQAAAAGVDLSDCPVINIERTRRSMIEAFLSFAGAEPHAREEIARKTRAFTERFHGYEACGSRLAEVYGSLTRSSSDADGKMRKVS